jgi:hypothetical protein
VFVPVAAFRRQQLQGKPPVNDDGAPFTWDDPAISMSNISRRENDPVDHVGM